MRVTFTKDLSLLADEIGKVNEFRDLGSFSIMYLTILVKVGTKKSRNEARGNDTRVTFYISGLENKNKY